MAMDKGTREKINARIAELEAERETAMTAYKDKDQQVRDTTQDLSGSIRKLREERGALALEAGSAQQKIDELKKLLADAGGK